MANNNMPTELFNTKTLFTQGGSSTAVWASTAVLGYVFNLDMSNYKWIGLIVAISLAFVGGLSIGKLNFQKYTVLFFNGLLIYVTACGIDSINHGELSLNKNQSKATIIPFTNSMIWWAPKELTDSIYSLKRTISLQKTENIVNQIRIKRILDSCSLYNTILDKRLGNADYEALYKQQLLENRKLQENIIILEKENLEIQKNAKGLTVKKQNNVIDSLHLNKVISEANVLTLKQTGELCYNLANKLDNFSSSGKYTPGTYNVSFLLVDILFFRQYLSKSIEDINTLVNKK